MSDETKEMTDDERAEAAEIFADPSETPHADNLIEKVMDGQSPEEAIEETVQEIVDEVFGGRPPVIQHEESEDEPHCVMELDTYLETDEYEIECRALSNLLASHDGAVENKKQITATLGAEVKDLEVQIKAQNRIVGTRKKQMPVVCMVTFEPKKEKATITRLDTGEVVETRRMSSEERQRTFSFLPKLPKLELIETQD